MRFVLRSFRNPLAQSLLLCIGQSQMRSRWWHYIIGIGGEYSAHENALLRIAGNNRMFLWIFARSVRAAGIVQTQLRFSAARVRAMALEATVRQDRPDISIVTNRRSLRPQSRAPHQPCR